MRAPCSHGSECRLCRWLSRDQRERFSAESRHPTLPRTISIVPCPEIAHSIQIVVEHVAVARRQPIITYHPLQPRNNVIQFRLIIPAGRQLALEFAQFLFCSSDSKFIAAHWKSLGLVPILRQRRKPIRKVTGLFQQWFLKGYVSSSISSPVRTHGDRGCFAPALIQGLLERERYLLFLDPHPVE